MNKTKNRKMDLFSRLWIRVIQFKNTGKREGDFFRDSHLFEEKLSVSYHPRSRRFLVTFDLEVLIQQTFRSHN